MGSRAASGLAVLLFSSLLHADYSYPPRARGDTEARLTVRAAERTAVPGLGEVTLSLTVTGPATLEVEGPRLSEAATAWKEERSLSTRLVQQERARWSQVIRLSQNKPGPAPLPEVSIRFRGSPDRTWEEATWVHILKEPRDVPGPPAPPIPQPSWLRRWGLVLTAGLAGLLLAAWGVKRWRGRTGPPLSPEQWALRQLERAEQNLMPPRGDAEVFHTELSHVVRRYLAERFGLPAPRQTTAEFLDAVHHSSPLSAEQQALLRDLFARCDLAKFARLHAPPHECQRTADLVRELLQQTTAAGRAVQP